MLRAMRLLSLLAVLSGCTFYVAGGAGDAGSDSDSIVEPDAQIIGVDAPDDSQPPVVDAAVDGPAPPIDAPIDAPLDANNAAPLETLIVPCNGQIVVSQLTYSSTLTYRVRASGLCKVDEFFGNDVMADAEYYSTVVPRDRESGVDVGIGLYDTTLGYDKPPSWGSYNANHVYEVTGPGYDVPVTVRFHDKGNYAYGNNSGSLTIEIFLQ